MSVQTPMPAVTSGQPQKQMTPTSHCRFPQPRFRPTKPWPHPVITHKSTQQLANGGAALNLSVLC
jgi:hypothetical protein